MDCMKCINVPGRVILLLALWVMSFTAKAQHQGMHHRQQNIFLSIMDTMMLRMEAADDSSSASHYFMAQMIPHHEGAIAMARFEILHGKDFTMIQLAKSILAEQSSEVQQMKLSAAQLPAGNDPVQKGFKHELEETMTVMMKNMPNPAALNDIDAAFASVMIPHHQAAIDMAKVVLKYSADQPTVAFAKSIISSEQVEIEQMITFLNQIK